MTDQPPTDQDDAPVLVSLEEAAAELGISVNAVRQRIKRHTVAAVKTEAGWLVDMVATNQRPTTQRPTDQATNQPTDHVVGATNQQPTTDLAPLADLIEKQTKQISDLSAAVGMWQSWAMHLDGEVKQVKEQLQEANKKLQQLTATTTTSTESGTDEAAQSPESNDTDDQAQSPSRDRRAPLVDSGRVWRDGGTEHRGTT